MRFRRSELFFIAYFVYAACVALVRPAATETRTLVVSLNAALIFWFILFAWAHKGRGFTLLDRVRDWYPLPLIVLAYREMGWIAQPHASRAFENHWIRLDRVLLDDCGVRALIESAGPVIPNALELAYLLAYAMPVVTVLAFYYSAARERIDDMYSIVLFATLTAYALYPYFPSDPPREAFAGADQPVASWLRAVNLRILDEFANRASVFPSGHAAAMFAAAFAVRKLLPGRKWLGRTYLALAIVMAVAMVYGRYDFAIDVAAGLALAALARALSRAWRRSKSEVQLDAQLNLARTAGDGVADAAEER